MYGGAFNQINVCPKIFHHSVWFFIFIYDRPIAIVSLLPF